jgi:adenylate cyclase
MSEPSPPPTLWKPAPTRRLTVPLVAASTLVFGLLFAIIGYDIESAFGLPLHFWLRGVQRGELPVAIVAMNHTQGAHKKLGLPYDYARWPRDFHARIVDKLTAAGARAIAFDVIFSLNPEQSADGDKKLADALRRSQRVVLGVKVE